jgi:cyanophycinase
MNVNPKRTVLCALLAALLASCAVTPPPVPLQRGTLLLIGGGLDNDNGPVYQRFLELAGRAGKPRIVIATAATGPQDDEATDKTEALHTWSPSVQVDVVRRETPTIETVAAIDAATAMFFTGGDQKRITERYRPGDQDTPEWLAMQRLLQRGGVIAGASAGDAMMGEIMFLSGGSARALGIEPKVAQGEQPPVLGPLFGPGMKFLQLAVTDSHFFERDRIGRLVAGLQATGRRLGIGVGEDAAVEVDLTVGEILGISGADSLLVDAAHLRREGLSCHGLRARLIRQGDHVSLTDRLFAPADAPPMPPAPAVVHTVPVVEPGQNRQLASWRLFRRASEIGSGIWRLPLDGWTCEAWSDGAGEVVFALIVPTPAGS